MFNLPLQAKYSLAPLLIITLSVVMAIAEPVSNEWLAYDRQQLQHYQWWRLVTGHLLHTNLMHLMLNIAGVTLLWALHGHYYSVARYFTVFIGLSLATSSGLFIFAPQMAWYVGLSGVLHGFFVIGAYFDIKHNFYSGWVLLLGVWLKVAHEQVFGANEDMAQLIAANVAIDAHLFGTIAGSIIVLYYFVRTRLRGKHYVKNN